MSNTQTPAEAAAHLASLAASLSAVKSRIAAAKEQLDGGEAAAAEAALNDLLSGAAASAALIGEEDVSPVRVATLIRAAAAGLSPAQLRAIAQAARVSSDKKGIVLPAGRFEHTSRGRGWCRKGSGDRAAWADRAGGGYRVSEPGKWHVGSTDGYSRKDHMTWDVTHVGDFWVGSPVS